MHHLPFHAGYQPDLVQERLPAGKDVLRCGGQHRAAYVVKALSIRQQKAELLLQQLQRYGLVVPAVLNRDASSASWQPR